MLKSGRNIFLALTIFISLLGFISCGDDKPTGPTDKPKVEPPVISSLTPADSAKVGDEVTITGSNFGDARDKSTVSFNGTPVSAANGYLSWSKTSLKVLVPVGATSGNVIVKVSDSLSNGKFLKIYKKDTIIDPPKDTFKITGLDKDSGKVNVTMVIISGYGFGAEQGESYVSFNNEKADNYLSWKDSTIKVYVPKAATTGNVTVTVKGVTSNGVLFKVIGEPIDDSPKVTSISPSSQQAGKQITISGKNFGASRGDGYVDFGGKQAVTYYSWSDVTIIVNIPDDAQTGKLKVYANKKFSNEVDYTILPPSSGDPVIEYLDANKVQIGKNLGILGKNFGATQGDSWVDVNGTKVVSYKSWTDEKIIIIIPEGATSGDVIVHVGNAKSNAKPVTITEPTHYVQTVEIPKGTFSMGPFTDGMGEAPAHTVNITYNFYMTKTEITQETWEFIMNKSNPSYDKSSIKKPVEQMLWEQTMVFCNRLSKMEQLDSCYKWVNGKVVCDFTKNGYRLPTEAEWEYACRAGSTSDPEPIGDYAWTLENANTVTQEVMGKKPNAWGLYDMLGNVYEWCWDEHSSFYYSESPANDPTGPTDGTGTMVIRGGNVMNTKTYATSRARESQGAATTDPRTGFRVVRKKL